jgi:LysM repeat protein
MKRQIVFQMLALACIALTLTACGFIVKPQPAISPLSATPVAPTITNTPKPTATPTATSTPTALPGELCPSTFVVMSGDTLLGISMQCGIPISVIMSANDLPSEESLAIGQTLFIPTPQPTATPTLTPTPTVTPTPTTTPTPTRIPQLGQLPTGHGRG